MDSSTNTEGNPVFERFVAAEFGGNRSAAGDALGCNRIHVWRMINGHRKVTPDMAQAIETMTKGRFKRDELVWPNSKRKRRG